jgi:hypothetical protein
MLSAETISLSAHSETFALTATGSDSVTLEVRPAVSEIVNLQVARIVEVTPDRISKYYDLTDMPPGTILPHGQGSMTLQAFFWPSSMEEDILWRLKPLDGDNAILMGPPLETFTGQVALIIFKFPQHPIQIVP